MCHLEDISYEKAIPIQPTRYCDAIVTISTPLRICVFTVEPILFLNLRHLTFYQLTAIPLCECPSMEQNMMGKIAPKQDVRMILTPSVSTSNHILQQFQITCFNSPRESRRQDAERKRSVQSNLKRPIIEFRPHERIRSAARRDT